MEFGCVHLFVCPKLVSQAKLKRFGFILSGTLIIHNYLRWQIPMINLFFLLPMKELLYVKMRCGSYLSQTVATEAGASLG